MKPHRGASPSLSSQEHTPPRAERRKAITLTHAVTPNKRTCLVEWRRAGLMSQNSSRQRERPGQTRMASGTLPTHTHPSPHCPPDCHIAERERHRDVKIDTQRHPIDWPIRHAHTEIHHPP
mmetsp:Transcript_1827/g.3972  ORF Transcript_1827/g.3972 Transcript_1827/m.3972 type:complete len:121 (-) Transcript_1827:632-994(-)